VPAGRPAAWSAFYAVGVETLTFLFTDIEGSTALLGRLGDDGYAQVLAGHHALIRSALAAHGGREIDTQGDAFFAVFSSPRACVAAVLQMQRAIQAHAWPGGERVQVRMGIHCGEAVRRPAGLVGLEVHRAARVAAVAYGGQVLVSEAAAVLVRDRLPAGAALADLGSHRLKDLGRPERIFQLQAAGLPAGFPPLRSLGNPALPNNLPGQLSAFIGRNREVAEVQALVESCRLVTLTGAGGCGKTRLGLQVAAELLDGSGDGVWLAELAAVTDQDAVAPAISQALRLAAQPGRPALEALLDALALQDVLIVVDNCEHLIGGCAKTAEAILRRCPRVHLLATSREPLGIGGETLYRVPSMSLPGPGEASPPAPGSSDAVALFADRARAQGVALAVEEQAGPVAVSVCRRLDGMPLAIELAAARLRSMSLAELHNRLDHRFRLLTGGSRTALERQQTLAATVGWSYSLLTGAERVLLGRLSMFAGGFDLAAAEAVCGSGGLDVLEVAGLLGSLVDKSLVVAEPAGGTPAVPAAGDHPPVRRRAAGRGRRRRGRGRRRALRAFPVFGGDGGRLPDRAGAGRLAGPAGRRPGQPAARRPARGRPPGRHRGSAAPRRRARALLVGPVPDARAFRAARAHAAAARCLRRPRAVRRGVGHRCGRRSIH
jgi:predicted ATPase/class 3 adenylate cyclase